MSVDLFTLRNKLAIAPNQTLAILQQEVTTELLSRARKAYEAAEAIRKKAEEEQKAKAEAEAKAKQKRLRAAMEGFSNFLYGAARAMVCRYHMRFMSRHYPYAGTTPTSGEMWETYKKDAAADMARDWAPLFKIQFYSIAAGRWKDFTIDGNLVLVKSRKEGEALIRNARHAAGSLNRDYLVVQV